ACLRPQRSIETAVVDALHLTAAARAAGTRVRAAAATAGGRARLHRRAGANTARRRPRRARAARGRPGPTRRRLLRRWGRAIADRGSWCRRWPICRPPPWSSRAEALPRTRTLRRRRGAVGPGHVG